LTAGSQLALEEARNSGQATARTTQAAIPARTNHTIKRTSGALHGKAQKSRRFVIAKQSCGLVKPTQAAKVKLGQFRNLDLVSGLIVAATCLEARIGRQVRHIAFLLAGRSAFADEPSSQTGDHITTAPLLPRKQVR
jgi:hypothetical protein